MHKPGPIISHELAREYLPPTKQYMDPWLSVPNEKFLPLNIWFFLFQMKNCALLTNDRFVHFSVDFINFLFPQVFLLSYQTPYKRSNVVANVLLSILLAHTSDWSRGFLSCGSFFGWKLCKWSIFYCFGSGLKFSIRAAWGYNIIMLFGAPHKTVFWGNRLRK